MGATDELRDLRQRAQRLEALNAGLVTQIAAAQAAPSKRCRFLVGLAGLALLELGVYALTVARPHGFPNDTCEYTESVCCAGCPVAGAGDAHGKGHVNDGERR